MTKKADQQAREADTVIVVDKRGPESKWIDFDPDWTDDDPEFDPYTLPPYEDDELEALVASGQFGFFGRDVPRDSNGKWTKGGGAGSNPAHTSETFQTRDEVLRAFSKELFSQGDGEEDIDRFGNLSAAMTSDQKMAHSRYTDSEYTIVNKFNKYGPDAILPENLYFAEKTTADLDSIIEQHGTPAPKKLMRGKGRGPMADLKFEVGTVYEEPGFGSWTTDALTAQGFTESQTGKAVLTRISDSQGRRSIPGTQFEVETIMPRGTRYRVTGIKDYFSEGDDDIHYRVIDVEMA